MQPKQFGPIEALKMTKMTKEFSSGTYFDQTWPQTHSFSQNRFLSPLARVMACFGPAGSAKYKCLAFSRDIFCQSESIYVFESLRPLETRISLRQKKIHLLMGAGHNSGLRARKSILGVDLGWESNSGQNGYLGRKSKFWPTFGPLKSPFALGLHCQLDQKQATTQANGLKNRFWEQSWVRGQILVKMGILAQKVNFGLFSALWSHKQL